MLKYLCFVEQKYVKIIYTEILEKVYIEEIMMPFIDYFNCILQKEKILKHGIIVECTKIELIIVVKDIIQDLKDILIESLIYINY